LVPDEELRDKSGVMDYDKFSNHPITLKLKEEVSKVMNVDDGVLWVEGPDNHHGFWCIHYLFNFNHFTKYKKGYEGLWVQEYWYFDHNMELKMARIVGRED